MAHTRKERHRDRDPGRRQFEEDVPARDRVFRLAEPEREAIAQCLRHIDDARTALEAQQNRENREIVRALRASADRIFDLINTLEETGPA